MSEVWKTGAARFGLLFLASSVGASCGTEVVFFLDGRTKSLMQHLELFINGPLLVPVLLLPPTTLVTLCVAGASWYLSKRRLVLAAIVAAVGCGLASYLLSRGWQVK